MKKIEDTSKLTDDEIADSLRRLFGQNKTVEAEIVRLALLLVSHGWSWRQIGRAVEMDHAAIYRWIQRRTQAAPPLPPADAE